MAGPRLRSLDSRRPGLRRRRHGVRGPGLRRGQRGSHRPRGPPEQGDDLLPLQEQGRALPRDPARHVRRRPRPRCSRSRRPRSRPQDKIRALRRGDRGGGRGAAALSADLAARDRRRRRARRRGDAGLRPRRARRARPDHRRRAPRRPSSVAIHPLMVQGGIIAPIMFFLATARLRQKMARAGADPSAAISRDTVVRTSSASRWRSSKGRSHESHVVPGVLVLCLARPRRATASRPRAEGPRHPATSRRPKSASPPKSAGGCSR